MRRLATLLVLLAAATASAQDLKRLQREFMRVGEAVIPATVIVRGEGADKRLSGSTGVIISPEGLVLSDADATLVRIRPERDAAGQPIPGRTRKEHGDVATIRLPDPDRRRFKARLLHRDEAADVSILLIEEKVRRLPYCPVGDSDALEVGAFAYVCGNSFGTSNEGKPALSAGIVSALLPAEERGDGRYRRIYTSAAVNPGNNGGPLVDLEGHLVGIVSTYDQAVDSAYRGFGIVTPIRRVLHRLRDHLPEGGPLPDAPPGAFRPKESRILDQALRILARRGASALVSVEIDRGEEKPMMKLQVRRGQPPIDVPRYLGPVSGVCIREDGLILISTWSLFARKSVKGFTARLHDGRVLPATLVARDEFRQIALLKVEATDLPTLEWVGPEDVEPGRFVLALGNPFGESPHVGPLVTFGAVSALHKHGPEMDAVQTDAGMNEAVVGGPLIDFRGRLVGVNLLVAPVNYGLNSGVGFVLPVWSIAKGLPDLIAGKTAERGYLGIMGLEKTPEGLYRFPKVVADGPAYLAGLRDGDLLVVFDGKPAQEFETPNHVIAELRKKRARDAVVLDVRRGDESIRLEITLGTRPEAE